MSDRPPGGQGVRLHKDRGPHVHPLLRGLLEGVGEDLNEGGVLLLGEAVRGQAEADLQEETIRYSSSRRSAS